MTASAHYWVKRMMAKVSWHTGGRYVRCDVFTDRTPAKQSARNSAGRPSRRVSQTTARTGKAERTSRFRRLRQCESRASEDASLGEMKRGRLHDDRLYWKIGQLGGALVHC